MAHNIFLCGFVITLSRCKFSSGVHPVRYNFVLAIYILQVYTKDGFCGAIKSPYLLN